MMKYLFAFLGAAALAGAADAALIHSYDFTTGLTDTVAGGVALTPSVRGTAVGTAAGGLYSFDRGAGLMLGSQLPGSVYTIEMRVALTDTGGYRKLISFENITSDLGLYNLSGSLSLFNTAVSASNTDFVAGAFTDVRISRNATGLVTGYVGGNQVLSYNDATTNYYTANSALYFLRDDTAQNGEDSAGQADYIRIYDTATPTVTPPVTRAVPEPASWAMMVAGFGLIGAGLRSRRPARVTFAA